MLDIRMPAGIIAWMQGMRWGDHHDQWHFERRWDFWHHLAANHPNPNVRQQIAEMIEYANSQGWQRAPLQEGEASSGLNFLIMHRAMLHLLLQHFPDAQHLLRGWNTPPQDPSDPGDLVNGNTLFDPDKAAGIVVIEREASQFLDDDAFALFLETNIRPTPADPTHRDPDGRLGLHNYLHNRWSDPNSAINLGDPKVNIFNRRFWKLHGWIDHQWWRFRLARGFADDDPTYLALLEKHKHMMSDHMHTEMAEGMAEPAMRRPEGFSQFFAF